MSTSRTPGQQTTQIQPSTPEDLRKFVNELVTLVAESITRFVMKKVPPKRIKEVNVVVNLRDFNKLLFEIDVELKTDALVKDEYVNQVVNEAVDYGFKLLDRVVELLKSGIYDLQQVKRIIKQFEREYLSSNTQKR